MSELAADLERGELMSILPVAPGEIEMGVRPAVEGRRIFQVRIDGRRWAQISIEIQVEPERGKRWLREPEDGEVMAAIEAAAAAAGLLESQEGSDEIQEGSDEPRRPRHWLRVWEEDNGR